jgi:hypothetical protein
MARPERHDVDYFPFFAKRGKTLNILQSKYGLEGIGFFTNLMRFLALTPDHYYCIKEEYDKLKFFAETGINDEWTDTGKGEITYINYFEAWQNGTWENDLARITLGMKNRVRRLKCLGNAVVPEIPAFIIELIARVLWQ